MANEAHTTTALSRRSFLRTAVGGSAALTATPWLLASSPTLASPRIAQADEQVLRVAFEGGIPAQGYTPGLETDRSIMPSVFMPPFMADINNKLMPWLATGFEANQDHTVFTIQIDTQAAWSDGEPVTAQDLKDWYDWVAKPELKSGMIAAVLEPVKGFAELKDGQATTISGILVKDDKSLEYHLTRTEPYFPLRLTLPAAAAGRVEQYQADPETVWLGENAKNLVVNGPFRPVSMEPEPVGFSAWEQNPRWWGDRKPTITRIEGTTIRDFQTMLLLFENQEIDMAYFLSGPPAVQLRRSQPEVFKTRPVFAAFVLYLDTTIEPLNDINLRLALVHAIDWEQMAQVAWEGEMLPVTGGYLMPPALSCHDENSEPYPFDVNKAKEFLAKSEYGTGDKVPKIRVSTAGSDPPRQRAVQIIQEYWRVNLGIENVEIKSRETEFGEEQGLIGVYTVSASTQLPVPGLYVQYVGHSQALPAQQWTKLNNPEVDQAIDVVLNMDSQDPAYCAEVNKTLSLIQDQAAVIPLAFLRGSYQVQPWLKNVEVNASQVFYTLIDMYRER